MPTTPMAPTALLIIFLLLTPLSTTSTSASFAKKLPFKQLRQKITHLHFYFHDIVSGPNATAVPILTPSKSTPSFFGLVTMIDDPLTSGPELTSAPVGRAQGFYAGAAQEELGFLMAMNLAFTAGVYNGSVLTVLGRNQALHELREMPVVGGSGLFRFATGYALAHTHWLDYKTGDAVVEYNVTVIHY